MNPFTTCFKFKSDHQPTRKYQFFNSFQHLESILKDPTLGPATHDPYLDDKPIIKIYPAMMALSAKPETKKPTKIIRILVLPFKMEQQLGEVVGLVTDPIV